MLLVAGTRWSFQRIRVQIRRHALVSKLDTGAACGYCLGAGQRASGGTADTAPNPSSRASRFT
jgi:hypothetical protein